MKKTHNKGKFLGNYKICKRKRFFTKEEIPGIKLRYTCSKGHEFISEGITADMIALVMEKTITREKLSSLFERDNAFYANIKK